MSVKWTELTTDNPINEAGFKLTMKAIETGERQPVYPLEIRQKSGSTRIVEVDESPLIDDHGQVIGMVGGLSDITDRRKAEEALLESETRYRAIVEDQTEFLERWLPDGTCLFVNESFARYSGRSQEDWVGDNIYTPMTPHEEKRLHEKISSLTPDHPTAMDLYPDPRSGSSVHFIEWTDHGIFSESGELIEVQSVGRDVTQRIESEKALQRVNTLLSAVIENTDENILISDNQGRPLMWNQAYARNMKNFLGIEMKSLLQPHKLLSDPEQVAWWDNLHNRVLGGEQFREEFSYPVSEKSNDVRHFEIYYYPIKEQGRVTGFTEFTRDITDRKQAESALQQKLQTVEKFNKAAVGRENRMIELKKEVNALCSQLGLRKRYRIPGESRTTQ